MSNNNYFNPKIVTDINEVTIPIEVYEPREEEGEAVAVEIVPGLTSIIIPAYFATYPVFHQTGNCIGSIREHTDKEKTPYEIILVENGNGVETFKDRFEQTYADKVIKNEENLGFAKAVNQGIRAARGEYIAIVNNDVQVFQHWLEDLQLSLRSELDLVMATPMYGMPFARAVEAFELRAKSFQEGEEASDPQIKETYSDFVDFSCILTRKEMFDKVGLFDEQFHMYGEDLDLLRRMKEVGLTYASTKRVNTHHIIGSTSSGLADTPQIMDESKEKLKAKWGF